MGKQNNKGKPTDRQIKKMKKQQKEDEDNSKMCEFLGKKWKNTITYKCSHCLREAYDSEMNNMQGYVTDEELIVASNNKLKHK